MPEDFLPWSRAIVSQLLKDRLIEAVDMPQLETFEAGVLFARTEGIIPAPESTHAIAQAIREAKGQRRRKRKDDLIQSFGSRYDRSVCLRTILRR